MTAIGLAIEDGRAWIAGDSRHSRPWTYSDCATKVWFCERISLTVGVAGSCDLAVWLEELAPEPTEGERIVPYLLRLGAACLAWCRETGNMSEDGAAANGNLLVARAGRAWSLCGTMVPCEIRGGFAAMGDPSAIEAAYRVARRLGQPAPVALRMAVEVMCEISTTVGGPVTVLEVR